MAFKMNWMRWVEFYEDEQSGQLSMNRLCTMVATLALFLAFLYSEIKEYDNTVTLASILAGLGGFSYATGKAAGAYTQVRMEQAKQGIPAPDVTPQLPPTTTINVGKTDAPISVKSTKRK